MLLSLPICKAWARYLPNIFLFGIPLNPGPFTIKEHVIITIMAGIGAGPAYAVSVAPTWQIMSGLLCSVRALTISLQTDIIAVQKVFYNQHPPFACEF
jgi:OPT oligopeptide transporter protein